MRMGVWYSFTGYVSIFSPLINYGFGQIGGGASSWKYMYWFAGALTIVWGLLLWLVLPPDPIRARGYTERERYILVARLRSNNSGVRNTHYKVDQVLELLVDPKFWLTFSVAFLSMLANAPISTFVPIIINGFGFTTLNSLLLLIPAGFYGGTIMLVLCYLAYRIPNSRCYLIFGAQMGTTLAALLLWLLPLSAKGGLLFATAILPSIGGGYSVMMGLSVANTAGYTKRSIASSGLFLGYCLGKSAMSTPARSWSMNTNDERTGNFVGPLAFKNEDAPRYQPGFIVVVVTSIVAALLILVYRYVCVWYNRKRDETGTLEGFDNAYDDDLTDMKVSLHRVYNVALLC